MYNIKSLQPSRRAQIMTAGLPMKTLGMEFSDLDPSPALEVVKGWVASVIKGDVILAAGKPSCGVGLLLVGTPGQGKTTMASTALQELIRGIPVDASGVLPRHLGRFMDYPKYLRLQQKKWDEGNDDVYDIGFQLDSIRGDLGSIDNTRVFILDDLGKEYRTQSGWSENQFDALLRSRFNAGLPTIVTTNVPKQDWGKVYGEPMGSFVNEAFIPVVVSSSEGDHRK
jgi:DNA replication protein DnaC